MNWFKVYSVYTLYGILTCISLSYGEDVYTDTWAVHIEGGEEHAQNLIEKHGFTYLNEVFTIFPFHRFDLS